MPQKKLNHFKKIKKMSVITKEQLDAIEKQVEDLQIALDEKQAQLIAGEEAEAALFAQKDDAIAKLNATVTELQAIIDSGASTADLDSIKTKLSAVATDLASTPPIAPAPTEPTPEF